jgi:hypothetical protein
MGKAARTKRQRNQSRTWRTRNPWTGQAETFFVRISDEALREWERDRAHLARAGYPDRPPELDSPKHRAWNLCAPGKPIVPGSLAGLKAKLGVDPTAKALGTWRAGDGQFGVKINVGRRDDGSFVLHFVFAGDSGMEPPPIVEVVPDAAAARSHVEAYGHWLETELGMPPLTWTSVDELFADVA